MHTVEKLPPTLAPLTEIPNGYEVISQYPLPKQLVLRRSNPKLFLYPLATALALPCAFIGSEGPGQMHTPLVTLAVALIVGIAIAARWMSERIIDRQNERLASHPTIVSAAADAGVPPETVVSRLSFLTHERWRNWVFYLGNEHNIFVNTREPHTEGASPRRMPVRQRSFGILRRTGKGD